MLQLAPCASSLSPTAFDRKHSEEPNIVLQDLVIYCYKTYYFLIQNNYARSYFIVELHEWFHNKQISKCSQIWFSSFT